MGDGTSIEWTDATWNPVRGCSRVSEGCRHCYAEQVAARFSGPGMPYEGLAKRVGGEGRWTGKVRLIPEHLADPLRWRKPRRIFVNSMSDLFHEGLTFEQIGAVFGVMMATPRHTFQVLTKRPARALEFFDWVGRASRGDGHREWMTVLLATERTMERSRAWSEAVASGDRTNETWPLANVWLGVSVEDQPTADERIPLLLECPAAVRFCSYEPALGPVDFARLNFEHLTLVNSLSGLHGWPLPHVDGPRLDWVIVGGESGPGARPFDVAWARETVRQCREAGVACFVKQLGAHPHEPYGSAPSAWGDRVFVDHAPGCPAGPRYWIRLRDRKGGDWNEWPADLRVREYPERQP